MPAVAKILVVFAAMLALTRVRIHLGVALVLGGVALNFWAGESAQATLGNLGHSLLGPDLWLLLVVTALIIEIGRYMTEEGNAGEIVAAARRWGGRHGQACSLMALPAVIGLVPMPAGALFSAPFVQQAGEAIGGRSEWKSAVNYWFRHVWEYWWPLYPGVIVAMSLFEMDTWQFIATQILFTPCALITGYLFLVRRHMTRLAEQKESSEGSNRRALFLLTPVMVVVLAVLLAPLVLNPLFPGMDLQIRKLLAVLLGLAAALTIVFYDERGGEARMFSSLLQGRSLRVLFTLAGVLIFKAMLDRSGLLPQASRELIESGIPVVFAIGFLPLLAGLVTGLAVGFTGAAFPLVVGLMAAEGSGLTPSATLILAYGFGYMGMMLSPVHLCLLVTREYFRASLWPVYRQILPCVLTVVLFSLAAHLVFSALGW